MSRRGLVKRERIFSLLGGLASKQDRGEGLDSVFGENGGVLCSWVYMMTVIFILFAI